MKEWLDIFSDIYKILQITTLSFKGIDKIRKSWQKEYLVNEIKENLETGELNFGDKISVLGTFSEYIPFIDPKFVFKGIDSGSFPRTFPRTARLEVINDIYCGAFFKMEQGDAFAEEVVPVFFGIDSPMVQRTTGDMLKIDAKITEIPIDYKALINQNEYFTYEKEDGLGISFGLKVLDVEPVGLIDTFKINSWLVGNLQPFPHFDKKNQNCVNCSSVFGYMPIEPLDWPIKYGCLRYQDQIVILYRT